MHLYPTWIVATALVLLFPTESAAQQAADATRPAKVFTVVGTETVLRRVYSGIALSSKEVELSFRVSGRVTHLPIRASFPVEEGAVIAQLDTRDFESEVTQLLSQRDQALAELEVLRTGARPEEIAALEAAVKAAEAQLDQAGDRFERTQQLVQRGVATTAQLQQDETSLRVAAAQFDAELERLAIGRAGGRPEEIAAAEAALRGLETRVQVARDNLADATLRAPFDGTIARRDIDNFVNVQAGETIALIQDLSTVDVVFDLPAADITKFLTEGVGDGTSVVTFDAVPGQSLTSELVEFSTQPDAATQTYRGRVSVKLPEGAVVLPGMVARVTTTVPTDKKTIFAIPLTALAAAPDGSSFVWRVDPSDNTVSKQSVSLGDVSGESVAITEGLQAGDVIVSAGVSQLQEGMAIRPINEIGG